MSLLPEAHAIDPVHVTGSKPMVAKTDRLILNAFGGELVRMLPNFPGGRV
ncbi:hypothetical protein [Luteimonas panaciterrae]|nr:hypothetical protein [Luteimonas panaciterrae]